MKNNKKKPIITKEFSSNVAQISRIKKTKKGYAVFLRTPVIFINEGLLDFIKKNQKAS